MSKVIENTTFYTIKEVAEKLQVNPLTTPLANKIEVKTLLCPASKQRGVNDSRAGKFVPAKVITKT